MNATTAFISSYIETFPDVHSSQEVLFARMNQAIHSKKSKPSRMSIRAIQGICLWVGNKINNESYNLMITKLSNGLKSGCILSIVNDRSMHCISSIL